MACNESVCRNSKCSFQEFNNTTIKVCPLCGDKVMNFFDESPEEHESPNGDDYIDIEEW